MPTLASITMLTLVFIFPVVFLLYYINPNAAEARAQRLRAEERDVEVRRMFNKAYHCLVRAFVTKGHLKEKQDEHRELLATMPEADIANLETRWQLRRDQPRALGIYITNDGLTLHGAQQIVVGILDSYTQLETLLDDAVEKLNKVQDDLNWFLLIEGTRINLRQTGRSKHQTVKQDIDCGGYEVAIENALTAIQLAVDGLWQ